MLSIEFFLSLKTKLNIFSIVICDLPFGKNYHALGKRTHNSQGNSLDDLYLSFMEFLLRVLKTSKSSQPSSDCICCSSPGNEVGKAYFLSTRKDLVSSSMEESSRIDPLYMLQFLHPPHEIRLGATSAFIFSVSKIKK